MKMKGPLEGIENEVNKRVYPPYPLLGVGGVVFWQDKVLLIKRKNPPGAGKWSIPGGLVKLGEGLKAAVRREVREETGLKVEVRDMISVVERIIPDEAKKIKYHYVILDFLCLTSEPLPLQASSDALEARWVSLNSLTQFGINEELKTIFKKAYQLWKRES